MKILLKPKSQKIDVKYDLTEVTSILKAAAHKKSYEVRNVKLADLDTFLFSGSFNSAIGLKGFQNLKKSLNDFIGKVNNENYDLNQIPWTEIYQLLLKSGIYYSEFETSLKLHNFSKNSKHLTAYRFVIKNFKDLSHKDLSTLAKRFSETHGQFFYIQAKDSIELKSISTHPIFEEKSDTLTYLKQLPIKQLKTICENIQIQPSRNAEETSGKIYKFVGEKALELIPQEYLDRKNVVFKNQDLFAGQDFIDLNHFLENTAKEFKADLVDYINERKFSKFFK